MHSAEPLREPRRDEVRAECGGREGRREGKPTEECAGPGWVGASGGPDLRGPAGRETRDHVVFVQRRRRGARPWAAVGWLVRRTGSTWPPRGAGIGACVRTDGRARCRWLEAPFRVSRPHPSRGFFLHPTASLRSAGRSLYLSLVLYPAVPSRATLFPAPLTATASPLCPPHQCPCSGSGGQGCSSCDSLCDFSYTLPVLGQSSSLSLPMPCPGW